MLGSGAIVVMDETTDAVKACLAGRAVLRPRVLRQVHAVPRGHHLAGEDPAAHPGRPRPPEDVGLLLDVCDNISPGIAWPPKQTTICPLGPSAVSPIASAIVRFRDEFLAACGGTGELSVAIGGKAYVPAPTRSSEVAGA